MNDVGRQDGKRVVVIGGTSGMGLGIARAASEAGAHVVVGSASGPERLASAREALGESGEALSVDITSEASLEEFFSEIGSLDHLVCTAAPGESGAFLDQPVDQARSYMDGKFWGSYTAARLAAPRMARDGSILFTTGGFAVRPSPGRAIVTATFAATEALARALALELAPLRVNALRPGLMDTPMWSFMDDEERAEFFARESRRIPAGRPGRPEDIGQAAAFLMGSAYVTGAVLDVDGGGLLA